MNSLVKFNEVSEGISKYDLLQRNLQKYIECNHFDTSLQLDAILAIFERKKDVLISAPQGRLNSVYYQLPGIMQENKITIVFSQSLLINMQIHWLRKRKICCEAIFPDISNKNRDRLLIDLQSKDPRTRFIYAKPASVASDLFQRICQSLHDNDKLGCIVVDDAQCVSQMANNFQGCYSKLTTLRSAYPLIPWVAIADTVTQEIIGDIVEKLQLQKPVETFKIPCFRKNLYYDVIGKKSNSDYLLHLKEYFSKYLGAVDHNAKQKNKPSGIIYCRTEETVTTIAKELTNLGIDTVAYNRELSSRIRTKIRKKWMNGTVPVIATTIRLNTTRKSTIRCVVHWDFPQSINDYYHESNAAGLDGLSSYCRIYYCQTDANTMACILKTKIDNSNSDSVDNARSYTNFLQVRNFCEALICRHKHFSDYFGHLPPECINRCDVCKNIKQAQYELDTIPSTLFVEPSRNDNGSDVYGVYAQDQFRENIIRRGRKGNQKKFDSFSRLRSFLLSYHGSNPLREESQFQTLIQSVSVPDLPDDLEETRDNKEDESTLPISGDFSSSQIAYKEESRVSQQISRQLFDITAVSFENQCVKSEPPPLGYTVSTELFQIKSQPPRNISPTNTIIKEEVPGWTSPSEMLNFHDHRQYSNSNDEFFDMRVQPPANVSPARTIIKEEKLHPTTVYNESINDTLNEEETVVKTEKVQGNTNAELLLSMSNIKREPMSPREFSSYEPQNQITEKFNRPNFQNISPTSYIIKGEVPSQDFSNVFPTNQPTGNVSPTPTLIKEERTSPTIEMNSYYMSERLEDTLESISENSFSSCASPVTQVANQTLSSIPTERLNDDNKTDLTRKRRPKPRRTKRKKASKRKLRQMSNSHDDNKLRPSTNSGNNSRFEQNHKIENLVTMKRVSNEPIETDLFNEMYQSSQPVTSKDQCKSNPFYERKRERKELLSPSIVTSPVEPEKQIERQLHDGAVTNKSSLTSTSVKCNLVNSGLIKQMEVEFYGKEMPIHMLNFIKEEKRYIAELVKKWLMPYFKEGKIQPVDLFSIVARSISHVFYDRFADETIIKGYIDDLFQRVGTVTSANYKIITKS